MINNFLFNFYRSLAQI